MNRLPGETRLDTGPADIAALAVAGAATLLNVAVTVLVVRWRDWTPMQLRQGESVPLVLAGGVLASLGALLVYGVLPRPDALPWSSCLPGSVLLLSGLTLMTWINFGRVYRMYMALILCRACHDGHAKVLFRRMLLVFTLTMSGLVGDLINPPTWHADLSMCTRPAENWALSYITIAAVIVHAGYVSRALAKLRVQGLVERTMIRRNVAIVLTAGIILAGVAIAFSWLRQLRGLMVAGFALTSLVMNLSLVGEPLYRRLIRDKEYDRAHQFQNVPSAELFDKSLGEQLYNEEVRRAFYEYAAERHAEENIQFYQACFERDMVADPEIRLAHTSDIIKRFIDPESSMAINVAYPTRQAILTGDIHDPKLFDEARAAVLDLINSNMGAAVRSQATFKDLQELADQRDTLERYKVIQPSSSAAKLNPAPPLLPHTPDP